MTITFSTIVSIAYWLLKLANAAYGWLHDQGVMTAERDRIFAAQIAEMAKRSTALREIETVFSKMTPKEVIDEIDKHGDFRD